MPKSKLPEKRERFCREYLKDGNATQAATRAGYSKATAKSQGQRLLTFVDVQARLEELNKPINEKAEIDAVWVREKLKDLHKLATREVPILDKDGEIVGSRIESLPTAAKSLELLGRLATVQAFKDQVEVTRKVRIIDLTGRAEDD